MNGLPHVHRLLSAVGFLLVGCSSHFGKPVEPDSAQVITKFDVIRDVVFTPKDWPQKLLADVYVPRGEGPWPGVLVIHGGGWESGDRAQVSSIAERLARRGFVAFNTTYRFAPEYRFPAQLQDVQLALRWMQDHAADYRMRPERIGTFGYSAGGHLAALLGLVSPGDPLAATPRPAAIVAGGAPSDFTKFPGGTLVPQLMGTTLQKDIDAYRRVSPVSHVSSDDPPTFLYHGGADALVSVDHAEDLNAALVKAGVRSELFILRGRGHIAAFLTDGPAFAAAATFLDRNLRAAPAATAAAR
ncbi:MAG: alpha/beta hydrolase fold domain-containing protein [Panacagrimonas sp.]